MIFAQKGYHRAAVDDIVRASRTSKGAVYHHLLAGAVLASGRSLLYKYRQR